MHEEAIDQEELFEAEPRGKKKIKLKNSSFSPVYEHLNGTLFEGDSIEWLKNLDTESVDLIFADPPYNIKNA
jgi:site-specific DNA-methyltransferase (adenine-specific)